MKIYSKDRRKPVAIFDDMSELDGLKAKAEYRYSVKRGEYYVVQLLLTDTEGEYCVYVEGLRDIATVYNTEGIDKFGKPFARKLETKKNIINPIYIGFDFSGYKVGEYSSVIRFGEKDEDSVRLVFDVLKESAENHGYNDITSLARLNWLNSTLASDDTLTSPFTPIRFNADDSIEILGRQLTFDSGLSLISVKSYFDESVKLKESVQAELLSGKCELNIDGEEFVHGNIEKESLDSLLTMTVAGESKNFIKETKAVLRAEGHLEYFINVKAKNDVRARVYLEIPFSDVASEYNMGLGKRGGKFSDIKSVKWDNMRHDMLYIGCVNCGATVRLKAENYRNPLVNVYYANLPIIKPVTTWDNNGLGSISAIKGENDTKFIADCGEIEFKKGDSRVFRYELFLTPYKPIDLKKHYSVRYYHNYNMGGNEYKHLEIAKKKGLNYINVHHGNELHPYINYPFLRTERLKKFIDKAKESNIGVKVYYTTREMSNHTAEVFAFKALGSEIIMQKKGQGLKTFNDRKWLDKYFGENVIQAWQVHYKRGENKGDHDIAFIITPDSRLDNYYIEGLKWLVDNLGISGIYIDDTSLDATTLRRAKKVLEPTGGLIDMHMWNHEEKLAGDAACLNIYSDILPFIDSLWIGEGFDIKKMSADYILTEMSGIPYGNTSQMLEGGGDQYAGMLYAMNNRYGWGVYNADRLYRVWDSFGIEDADMYGYWHSAVPIKTDNDNVKATVYLKDDKALVALYNFSDKKQKFSIIADSSKLGFVPKNIKTIYLSCCDRLNTRNIELDCVNALKSRKGILIEIAK